MYLLNLLNLLNLLKVLKKYNLLEKDIPLQPDMNLLTLVIKIQVQNLDQENL